MTLQNFCRHICGAKTELTGSCGSHGVHILYCITTELSAKYLLGQISRQVSVRRQKLVYEGAGGAHVLTEAIFNLAVLLSSLVYGYKREFLTGPRLQNTFFRAFFQLKTLNKMAAVFAKDCLLTVLQQACTEITWLFVRWFFIGPRSDHSLPMSLTN